jgi:hypothetical protein
MLVELVADCEARQRIAEHSRLGKLRSGRLSAETLIPENMFGIRTPNFFEKLKRLFNACIFDS